MAKLKFGVLGKFVPGLFLLRVFLPFLIFVSPIFAAFFNWFLDLVDAPFYNHKGFKRISYQLVDKTLDLEWYTISLFYAKASLPFFNFLVILYTLRLIGHFAFYFTKSETYLILLPNFYEFFLWLLILTKFYPSQSYLLSPDYFFKVLAILFSVKFLQEIVIHKLDRYFVPLFPKWIRSPQ